MKHCYKYKSHYVPKLLTKKEVPAHEKLKKNLFLKQN